MSRPEHVLPHWAWGLIAAALAAIGLFWDIHHWNVPTSTLLDLIALLWTIVAPGTLLLLLALTFLGKAVSLRELVALGIGVGSGIFPSVNRVIAGNHELAFVLVSALNLILGTACLIRRKGLHIAGWREASIVFTFSLAFAAVFCSFYNLPNLHFTDSGDLATRSLFGVDIPFLAGEVGGLMHFGALRDLHQLALAWSYHENTYRTLAGVASVTGSSAFDITAFSSALLGYWCLSFVVYVLAKRLLSNTWHAVLATLGWFCISTFTGTEQGSYALSPSFIWGSIVLVCICLVLQTKAARDGALSARALTAALLIILGTTKLSTFLILSGAMLVYTAMRFAKHDSRTAIQFGLKVGVAFVTLAIFGLSRSPLMPADRFIIGGPLLGYANHVASALHIDVRSISPVSKGFALHVSQLLIPIYFLFHFLRFVIIDPRIIAVVLFFIVSGRYLRNRTNDNLTSILLVMIPLGFLLPVLYSPSWYPLALSFYAPLASIQATYILLLCFIPALVGERRTRLRIIAIAMILLVIGGIIGNTRSMLSEAKSSPHVTSHGLIAGLHYLRENSEPHALIASHQFDFERTDTSHDESFYIHSAIAERPVISEGAKYGSLLASVANIDSIKGLERVPIAVDTLQHRRADIDSIFLTTDERSFSLALAEYRPDYILEDFDHQDTLHIDHSILLRHAALAYHNSSVNIWKLR